MSLTVASSQTFQIQSCGAALVAHSDARQVKCPYCGTQVIVPDTLRTPQAAPPSWSPPVVVQVPRPVAAPPTRSLAGGCLVTLVFIVVILGVVGYLAYTSIQQVTSFVPYISTAIPAEARTAISEQGISEATREPDPTMTPEFASPILQFGSKGTGAGFFDDARGIATDGAGNFYVSEYSSGRVQRFDKDGTFQGSWQTPGKTPLRGLAADRAGTVYVVRGGAILKYNGADGTLLATLQGEAEDNFDDVAVFADGSLEAVSYHNRDDLVHLSADGQVLSRIPAAIGGQSDQPELLTRVAVDGQGTIFALGTFNDAVFKFAPDGKFVTRFGSQGNEPGQFGAPLSIAVDNQSRVYVGEGSRVQVFTPDGRFVAQIDNAGSALGLSFTSHDELLVAARDHALKMVLTWP